MASIGMGRKPAVSLVASLMKKLNGAASTSTRCVSVASGGGSGGSLSEGVFGSDVITSHTAKWMQDTSKKSPMELINEVPPIKVDSRIVACEGDNDPALGHPIEFICLDLDAPAICKYCGLRYVQDHHH